MCFVAPSLPRSGGEGWGEEALIVKSRDFIGFQITSPALRLSPRKRFCRERGLKARWARQYDRSSSCRVQGFNSGEGEVAAVNFPNQQVSRGISSFRTPHSAFCI